jgi:uncharacterized repeat protein (TIGR02543 family)
MPALRRRTQLALGALLATGVLTAVPSPALAAPTVVADWDSLSAAFAGGGEVELGADITAPGGGYLAVPASGSVSLDLHGHDLTIDSPAEQHAAIEVPGPASFTVTDSARSDNALAVTGGTFAAGIGGAQYAGAGTVTIDGARVTATGGNFAAGIGGGSHGAGGTLTVTGDSAVTATGRGSGAGIGGGPGGDGGTVITRGTSTITATGSTGGGAGIGGGSSGAGGTVTTYDASAITATGIQWGAGIGGGGASVGGTVTANGTSTITATGGTYSAGIGGGSNGAGGVFTANDASTTTATSGPYTLPNGSSGTGIGGGNEAAGGDVTIGAGASVTVSGTRAIGSGDSTSDWGTLSNAGTLTIPSGSTLPIPAGLSVTNTGTITNNGQISGTGTIVNTGRISGTGSVAGNGQGITGTTVTKNSYVLSYDDNRPSPDTHADAVVLAPTLTAAGASLPAPATRAGWTFTGWWTDPDRGQGTRITAGTTLATALGDGPKAVTLYAQYAEQSLDVGTWAALVAAFNAGDDAIRLTADLTAPSGSYLTVPNGGTVGLDLHGHDLTIRSRTYGTPAITVWTGSTLTVTDSDRTDNALTATATGPGNLEAPGIGSRSINLSVRDPGTGTVVIEHARVVATGAESGAGIGGGYGRDGGGVEIRAGATVTATGGDYSAGIGGGYGGAGGTVTIDDSSTVTATGGELAAGIGGGVSGSGGSLTIGTDASVTVVGARGVGSGLGATGSWGSLENVGTLTVPAGSALPVPAGATATNTGTIVNDGQITGTGTIVNTGRIAGSGTVAGNGQGGTGTTVTKNSFVLSYDDNRPSPGTHTDVVVLAPTLDDAGGSLPTPTTRAGWTFTGWWTDADPGEGTQVTATTALAPALGDGPRSVTLYAHYEIAQAVAFTSTAPTSAAVGDTYEPIATGGDSTSPVEISIDPATTNGACTIADGVVSLVHVGTCVLAADQAEQGFYTAAPTVNQSFAVGSLAQGITFTSNPASPAHVGETYTPTAVGGGSAQPVVFSIDPATTGDACTISAGVVSLDHAGTCVVAADQAGDADHTAAETMTQSFAVSAAPTTTSLTLAPARVVHGQATTATAHTSAAGTVQFVVDGSPFGDPVPTSGGVATSGPLAGLQPGGHSVRADFTPADPTTLAGSSATTPLAVDQAASTTTLQVGPKQLTAVVAPVAPGAGTPTGTITFTVSGQTVGTASLTGGTATLSYAVPSGKARTVAATYAGDARFTGSAATTESAATSNPTITALVTGKPNKRGWYDDPVTVRFTCTADGAPLAAPCPNPVTLRRDGAGQSVTRTVTATDGGVDTVVVKGIDIDQRSPKVRVRGVRSGHTYTGAAPEPRCQATDALSGLARCTVRKRTTRTATGTLVRYRAVAVDRAGNRGSATGSYRTRTAALEGAPLRDGRFQVTAGSSYRLVVSGSAVRPVYYNAELAPRRPHLAGQALHPAGHHRWAITVRIDESMRGRTWNVGIKIRRTMQVVPLQVR